LLNHVNQPIVPDFRRGAAVGRHGVGVVKVLNWNPALYVAYLREHEATPGARRNF
jgi:hypothetical protein